MRTSARQLDEHLQGLLTYSPYPRGAELKALSIDARVEWIVRKLTAKRFRRGPLDPSTVADLRQKVTLSIEEGAPVYVIMCFGGYKHFWNPSHPLVDWAELFNLAFMARYLSPILAAHEPGVQLDYESEDLILPLIDNYPETALDSYSASFRRLLSEYTDRARLPKNLNIRLFRPQEEEPYASSGYATKLFERIAALRPSKEAEWASLSSEEVAERLHRTPRSIMWDGARDLTDLSEGDRQAYMRASKILNETYYDADFEFRGDYLTGGTHIPVVQTWGLSAENADRWLTLASTHGCTVDFWIGRGIVEHRGDRLLNQIVSRHQYAAIRPSLVCRPAYGWASEDPLLRNLREIEVAET